MEDEGARVVRLFYAADVFLTECPVRLCWNTIGAHRVLRRDAREIENIRFLKPNSPKVWHPFRQFSDRNCMQYSIQNKSDKS